MDITSRDRIREIFHKQRENYTPIDFGDYLDRMEPKLKWSEEYFAQAEKRGKIQDRC